MYFISLRFGKSKHFLEIPNIKTENLTATLNRRDHGPVIIVDSSFWGFGKLLSNKSDS